MQAASLIIVGLVFSLALGWGVASASGLATIIPVALLAISLFLHYSVNRSTVQHSPIEEPDKKDVSPSVGGTLELSLEGRNYMIRLFATAFLVRFVLSILILLLDTGRYLDGDGVFCEDVAVRLNEFWKGIGAKPQIVEKGENGFYYLVSFQYYLFGYLPFVPKLFNCIVGSLIPPLVYRIALYCFHDRAAKIAAWLILLFPSFIIWSALNVKDSYVIFFMLFLMWNSIKLRDHFNPLTLLLVILSLVAIRSLRNYLAILILFAVVLNWFLVFSKRSLFQNYIFATVVLIVFIVASQFMGFTIISAEDVSLERLNDIRSDMAKETKHAAYHSDADISTPGRALRYFPIGLAYYLFSPFPWAIDFSRPRQLMAVPEILVWYYLIPSTIRGLLYTLRSNIMRASLLITMLMPLTVAFSFLEGNVGTAFRHRAHVLVILLIFSGVGWYLREDKKTKVAGPVGPYAIE